MSRSLLVPFIALLLFAASCKPSVKPEALYGKWKYIKVDNPNANPPDSVKQIELQEQAPYIQFSKNDSLVIIWGGKVLSHGTYKINGSNINVKEILADGKTRDFPFYVSELTDKKLVFESLGEDGSKVVAVKE